jgi:cell division protease FtsH
MMVFAMAGSSAESSCEKQPDSSSTTANTSSSSSASSSNEDSGGTDGSNSNPSSSGRLQEHSPEHNSSFWQSWKRPSPKRWNWVWNWKNAVSSLQAHEVGAFLLQLSIVIFLMRLLRPGFPLSGPRPPVETHVSTTYVNVAFSDFLHRINSNEVEKVEVDGVHMTFSLRPLAREVILKEQIASLLEEAGEASRGASKSHLAEGESLAPLVRAAAISKRIVYTTIRPSDMTTPYEKMVEYGVEFGAPDRRSVKLLNSILVSSVFQQFSIVWRSEKLWMNEKVGAGRCLF